MTPAEDMATPAEDTLAREIEADMDRHVEEAKAASALEPPADAAAATPADAAVDTPAHDTATCAKCKTEGKVDEMISRPSFRVELRHICRPCNAVATQFQRKGVQLTELLSEESMVAFFSECALERKNAEDGRLLFARARDAEEMHGAGGAPREA